MPPVIGWSAVTGAVDPHALLLFLIIFAWTPPHFWALAIHRRSEYAAADVPMLPVTHGVAFTRLQILLYTLLLLVASLLPYVTRMSGIVYLAGAVVLGAGFVYYALALMFREDPTLPMRTFGYSIIYLFGIFAAFWWITTSRWSWSERPPWRRGTGAGPERRFDGPTRCRRLPRRLRASASVRSRERGSGPRPCGLPPSRRAGDEARLRARRRDATRGRPWSGAKGKVPAAARCAAQSRLGDDVNVSFFEVSRTTDPARPAPFSTSASLSPARNRKRQPPF